MTIEKHEIYAMATPHFEHVKPIYMEIYCEEDVLTSDGEADEQVETCLVHDALESVAWRVTRTTLVERLEGCEELRALLEMARQEGDDEEVARLSRELRAASFPQVGQPERNVGSAEA
jgi:hypothetical protein